MRVLTGCCPLRVQNSPLPSLRTCTLRLRARARRACTPDWQRSLLERVPDPSYCWALSIRSGVVHTCTESAGCGAR
eukprot:13860751-Alexandrium_andersonii.AAC.1